MPTKSLKKKLIGGTVGNAKVIVTPKKIIKTYGKRGKKAFENELRVYKLAKLKKKEKKNEIDFIPKLLEYDEDKRKIVIENVGVSLDKIIKKDKKKKDEFLPKIKKVYNKFVRIFKLYHNDLRYKNIVYNKKKNKLYLIDFEFTSNIYEDKNNQGIVAKISKKKKIS